MTAPTRDDTRQRILQIALELFTLQGFDGTSLQQIADRLGVTKAALYYHFKSKDDLLDSVTAPLLVHFQGLLGRADARRPGPSARRAAIEDYLDFLIEHRALYQFILRDVAVLARLLTPANLRLRDRLAAHMAGSDRDDPTSIVLATMAMTGMQGAVIAHVGLEPGLLREVVLRGACALFRQSVAQKKACDNPVP